MEPHHAEGEGSLETMIDVSIILVNYHTYEQSAVCIRSIYANTPGTVSYEIILVDNSPDDAARQNILSEFPFVNCVVPGSNLGFARANNMGIARSTGEFILLLNPDTWLLHDALTPFVTYMRREENAKAACSGGKLSGPNGEDRASYGNFPSLLEAFSAIGFYVFYRSYFSRHVSIGVTCTATVPFKADYICGADLFIRRSVLSETGAFDPDFFLYFEEAELCFRFKKHGYYSVVLPEVNIVHLEGGSLQGSDGNARKQKNFALGRKLFFEKCYGPLPTLAMQFLYQVRAGVRRAVDKIMTRSKIKSLSK